jgi:hypothetical protein
MQSTCTVGLNEYVGFYESWIIHDNHQMRLVAMTSCILDTVPCPLFFRCGILICMHGETCIYFAR